jgi:Alpha/beta hydrolase domain
MATSALQIELLTGGSGRPALSPRGVGSLVPCAPMGDGYQDAEYLVKGAATTYSGPATGPARETGTDHRFATRLITRYPRNPGHFSGRIVLEPFNTSRNGIDSDVVWEQVAPLLQFNGDAWIGVTVRSSAGGALRASDPERYAELDLAINDLEWDILRQVGLLAKEGDGASLIGGNVATRLYMAGYSQSAVDTATFAMAVHGLSRTVEGASVFDGYFPAAHSEVSLPWNQVTPCYRSSSTSRWPLCRSPW